MNGGDLLWRLVLRWVLGRVPPPHAASTIGDLAEDYAEQRARLGRVRGGIWLLREARSLASAYREEVAQQRPPFSPTGRPLMLTDFVHALRRLTTRPAAPVLCAALLALGIGLSTAMFSVVDSLMLRPLPFREPGRLVELNVIRPRPVLEAWRSSGVFEAAGIVRGDSFQVSGDAAAIWRGAFVSADVFDMLEARPLHGRLLTTADAASGTGAVLLSESVWETAFGRELSVVGRTIAFESGPAVVVGILPGEFQFPDAGTVVWKAVDPSTIDSAAWNLIARLRADVPLDAALARLADLAPEVQGWPRDARGEIVVDLRPLRGQHVAPLTARALPLLLAGVAVVFLVLCGNVSSLLLGQLSARRREIGVCSALGASRMRLLFQTLVEHAGIAIAGAAGGIALAHWLVTLVPDVFVGVTLNPIDIDPRALWSATTLAGLAVVLAGVVPAWLGTRVDTVASLRASRQAGGDTAAARALRQGVLIAQIAVASALLLGSTVLLRSFDNLRTADRGLEIDGVVRGRISLVDGFESVADRAAATSAVEAQIRSWPEVSIAAFSDQIPPERSAAGIGPIQSDAPGAAPVETRVRQYGVTPSFFDLYGIPILRGRALDATSAPTDAVVGARVAGVLWPEQDPIGRTFTHGTRRTRYRVIGVAREITLPTLSADLNLPEFYRPLAGGTPFPYVSLRCPAACPDNRTIQARIRQVHPAIEFGAFRGGDDEYLTHLRLPRAMAEVAAVFAVVAILTAAGGLFSVLSYFVGRRTREFGIRAALGATPGQMRQLVLTDGFRTVLAGLALGVLGGWSIARALAAFHYGTSAVDPVAWAVVLLIIGATSLAASWRPARLASRVDPVRFLREE